MSTAADPNDAAPSNLAADQLADFFERVRGLIEACGSDRNGQAIAAASATIDEGMNTRSQIVGVLTKLGFDYRHANIILKGGTKEMQHDVPWVLDKATGRYFLKD